MPEYLIRLKDNYPYGGGRKLSDGTVIKPGQEVAIKKKLWESLKARDIEKGPEYAEFMFRIQGPGDKKE